MPSGFSQAALRLAFCSILNRCRSSRPRSSGVNRKPPGVLLTVAETGEVRFEKLAADRTKVTYQLEYEPTAWEGEADTVRDWINRRLDWDLDQFRKIVEPVP